MYYHIYTTVDRHHSRVPFVNRDLPWLERVLEKIPLDLRRIGQRHGDRFYQTARSLQSGNELTDKDGVKYCQLDYVTLTLKFAIAINAVLVFSVNDDRLHHWLNIIQHAIDSDINQNGIQYWILNAKRVAAEYACNGELSSLLHEQCRQLANKSHAWQLQQYAQGYSYVDSLNLV